MPMTRWLLACALMMGLILNSSGAGFSQGPQAPKRDPERHPHLRAAMRDLRQAKNQLGHADQDFGGHAGAAARGVDLADAGMAFQDPVAVG